MSPPADPWEELATWDCHAGDVAFAITAPSAWLFTQRSYLSDFLTTPPGELELVAFTIRVHNDDAAFRRTVETITRSPTTSYIEPVPGVLMHESRQPTGRRCYVIATDTVEHQPGAYAVAVQGRDIELFTHTGTARPHRYPIRLVREAMLRTYEDAGGIVFHAAGVDVGDAAVMVCGPSGAGKTTVTAALLRSPGAALLSNDRLVAYQGDHIVAVPLPVPTARGTIQAFPELERLARRATANGVELDKMPADFGSMVKHAFTAREFAEAFDARLISRSALRLVVVPRLADTDEPAQARNLSVPEARQVLAANCFTPRDEFWVRPWLIPRQSSDEQLSRQASTAVEYIAANVPCIEVSFGVRNPVAELARVLEQATGGVR
jgi:predicted ATPase